MTADREARSTPPGGTDAAVHIPKYLRLKQQLLAELRAGRYPVGERIPTREELVARFGVTRTTVNLALKELVACGVLATSRRGGTVFTGGEPPRRIVILSGFDPAAQRRSGDDLWAILESLVYRSSEFKLTFHKLGSALSPAMLAACDRVVAIMPNAAEFAALKPLGERVLFVNRSGEGLAFISTPHRETMRELVRRSVAAAGDRPQMVFLSSNRASGFVEQERQAGFIDECAEADLFYRLCQTEPDFNRIPEALDALPLDPNRKLVLAAPSMSFTGAVVEWARRRKRRFGVDLFYSDFDDPAPEREFGVPFLSAVQDYPEMGRRLYDALKKNPASEPVRDFVPCRLIG